MNVAWGSRLSGETKGLDAMGIRALDQNIEASLTNGITTISIRARYISILAWAIGQYFVDESAGGRVRHDKEARAVYLNRVRFLVLAATLLDEGASRMGAMALKAFELLVTQARNARAIGVTPGASAGDAATAARAIQLVESGVGTLAEVMLTICDECVAQRHIQNTMRKMGNQQDCSLRFYPDGPVLVPTEIDFSPGYSGSRLQNTMRILADLGMLNIGANAAIVAAVGG